MANQNVDDDMSDEEWRTAWAAMNDEQRLLILRELEGMVADCERSRIEAAQRVDSFWLPPRGRLRR